MVDDNSSLAPDFVSDGVAAGFVAAEAQKQFATEMPSSMHTVMPYLLVAVVFDADTQWEFDLTLLSSDADVD